MNDTQFSPLSTGRRNVVRGAAWSVPVVSAVAAVPAFAASACSVEGGLTVGPNVTTNYRAICSSQSQQLNPTTIKNVYGNGELPQIITLCTCDKIAGWYRWRETDTLSNFQIEVSGKHSDQNGPQQGYRDPIYLDLSADGTGQCFSFPLSYRTSAERSKTQRTFFRITWTLQRSLGNYGPGTPPATVMAGAWTDVQTFTREVSIIRTVGTNNNDQTNFDQCSSQGRVALGKTD